MATLSQRHTVLSLSALALLITGEVLYAGPLNPPAGPVAPTHKTLTEVEPRIAINAVNTPGDDDATPSLYKITQPGSYYLTANITGVMGKTGIEIATGGVTLDLNGFELVGVNDGSGNGSLSAVTAPTNGLTNIAVINGTIRNWPLHGVLIGSFNGTGFRVERLRVSGNGGIGISVPGVSIISGCTVVGGSTGISAGQGCTVTQCAVSGTSNNGFSVDSGGTLTECMAYNTTGTGIFANSGSSLFNCNVYNAGGRGIVVTNGATVAGCTVYVCVLDAIHAWSNCVIRDSNVVAAGQGGDGAGIYIFGNDTRVEGNTCTFADRGVQLSGSGNFAARNICSGNTTDWVFTANNVFGPIIDRRAPASGAVNGFSAASSLGSTDANANFSY